MTKQNYIILESFNSREYLEKQVSEKMDEGYIPQGSVFVKRDNLTYVQAMILKEEE